MLIKALNVRRGQAVDILKDAAVHELRELLNALNAMEILGSFKYGSVEKVRRRIKKLCDILDAIERNEQVTK